MQDTSVRPRSLKELNQLLFDTGFRRLSRQELDVVRATNGALDKIIQTAVQVSEVNDQGSRVRMQKILSWIGTEIMNREAEAGQAGSHPAADGNAQAGESRPTRSQAAEASTLARPAPQSNQQRASDAEPAGQERYGNIDTVIAGEAIVQTKIYGGKGVMQFEVVRPMSTKRSAITLMIEGTKGANKQYNWSNKVVLQCTPEEVVQLAAVLHGIIGQCKFANHGLKNDKAFEIINQGESFFMKIWSGDKDSMASVPMPRQWAGTLGLMVMSAVKRMYPGQSTSDILTSLRRTLVA